MINQRWRQFAFEWCSCLECGQQPRSHLRSNEHHHHPRQESLEPSTNQYGILLNKSIPARALARAAPGLRLKAILSVGCRIRLQTSCWVLQLRVQAEPAAGFRVPVVGPTTTQAFWQFIACVSQVPEQAVDACGEIKGVGVSGTGWTSSGVTICPGTACARRIRSVAKAVECQKQRPELRL